MDRNDPRYVPELGKVATKLIILWAFAGIVLGFIGGWFVRPAIENRMANGYIGVPFMPESGIIEKPDINGIMHRYHCVTEK